VEQHVRADLPGVAAPPPRREGGKRRFGQKAVPYLLGVPAGVWLLVFFLVPLVTMLSLSLQTCDPVTLACTMTWHFAEFPQQISEFSSEFIRSVAYGGIATVIDLVVAFPLAYWIAFYGGKRKNFFLLMLLLPFFVSFVIRTLAWSFILSDSGIVFGTLKNLGLLPETYHVLSTGTAVIAGIAYNFLPFTALPLYVALERIDHRVLEAAGDLYATKTRVFLKVILPLAVPGIFAAFLLTFVPAAGDFVNASILGGPGNTMIGNVIQTRFLVFNDYPSASALSAILMGVMLIGIFAYSKILGSRTIEEYI
jgi:spermidine/putrescine transport system permease protein